MKNNNNRFWTGGIAATVAALAIVSAGSVQAQQTQSNSPIPSSYQPASYQPTQTVQATAAGSASIRPGALYESGDLGIGSSGQAVAELQGMLAELGYLVMPTGSTPGYFGPLTANALARFQQAIGVPGTGYFGPMSRTAFALYYWNNPTFNQTYPMAQSGISTTTSANIGTTGTSSSSIWNGAWRYDGTSNQWINSTNNTSSGPSAMGGNGYWYNGSWYNTDANVRTDALITTGSSTEQ